MRKLTVLLFFIPTLLFSQEKTDASKIKLGFFAMPEVNHLIIRDQGIKEKSIPKVGVSAGFSVEFSLAKWFAIRSGLGYGFKRYGHRLEDLHFGTDINPQQGVISTSDVDYNFKYSEVQLPFLFDFKLAKSIFISMGAELNKPFANKSERKTYLGNGTTTTKYNNPNLPLVNFAFTLSAGYSIFFSDNTSLLIEPVYKYYFTRYTITEAGLQSFGMKLTYHFGL